MPLSEHEQRLLEQMERALYAEDPKFASSLRGRDPRSNFRRRVLLAGIGFVVGVVLLMLGLVTQLIVVSIVGFVADARQCLLRGHQLSRGHRRRPARRGRPAAGSAARRDAAAAAAASAAQPAPEFMDRMEERWNRRRDENGR